MVRRVGLIVTIVFGILAAPPFSETQQPPKVPRIGILFPGTSSTARQYVDAFRQGLRELGYVDGQNIAIESRTAEGSPERLPSLAAELAHLKLDLIVSAGIRATRAAKEAAPTLPIVVAFTSDLVGTGLVQSLARPGGTVTGLSAMSPDLSAKRLEMLKEAIPKISRVAVLWNSVPGKELKWEATQAAAKALGVTLQSVEVRSANDFERAFAAMAGKRADAFLAFNDGFTSTNRTRIVDLALFKEPTSLNVRTQGVRGGWRPLGVLAEHP